MAGIASPAGSPADIVQLSAEESSANYLSGFYAALLLLGAFLSVGGGLYLLSRAERAGGILAFAVAGLLIVLSWATRSKRRWRHTFSLAVHLVGVCIGLLLLVRWFVSVLGVIGADPAIAQSGGAPGVILARLSQLPIDPLLLADGLLVFTINASLWLLVRYIRRYEAELQVDSTRRSELEMLLQRFLKSRSARVGGTLVLFLLVIVYVMPRIDPYTSMVVLSDGDLTKRLRPPDCVIGWIRLQQGIDTWRGAGSAPTSLFEFPCEHPFGMDKNGRDLLRRVLHGVSVSLAVSVISVGISLLIGASIGLVAGYLGGQADNILMRSMDIMLAFPALLLAIAIVAMRGPGLDNAMIAIGIVGVPVYARLARSMSISLREQEFVTAAHSLGASRWRTLRDHILPNSLAPLIVQSTLGLGTAVIETAALGFLGLGQQPPYPELGKMLAESREVMTSGMWWMMLFPGVTVMIIVLSFNLLGDALRDTLDPKLRGHE